MGKIYFYLVFFILSIVFYGLLNYEKKFRIQKHLEDTTVRHQQGYNVIYNEYKKISDVIFRTNIDIKEIKEIFKEAHNATNEQKAVIREKLFNSLNETYTLLKDHNIKQLHFHLPNNESFLRFHRPSKFGDNLTNIRATVKYVNDLKIPIDGFEEGRIYNGYRYVYPLFYNDEHIGSVEVSFSTLAMNTELIKNFDLIGKFLIAKNVVDEKVFKDEKGNYAQSQFENFLYEKKIDEILQIYNKRNLSIAVSDETKKIIKEKGFDNESFSLYDTKSNSIMTFIKVQNPISNAVVGMIVLRSGADYIVNKEKYFYLIFIGIEIILILSLLFVYRILNQKRILNSLVEEKTQKLNAINKTLEESEHELQILNENLEHRISEEVNKNREKDKMLFEQTKMAALGEMIGNIAHQWRQPLSAITATASGMIVQKEMGILSDEVMIKNLDTMVMNGQYLSKTIDDFRNFIRGESKKELFNLKKSLDTFSHLVDAVAKENRIELHIDVSEGININGLQNELNQCLINLFNNAKDALKDKNYTKHVFISTYIDNARLIINCKDNGGGIDEGIINKIFEPYFTTKHQSQGTGLGLNMVYKIIREGMGGSISVSNETYRYNGHEYIGASFTIELPLN